MLIDAKHKPWLWTVVALTAAGAGAYVPYHALSLHGPSGGSWPGIAFGLVAFALMVFVGLLGLRRQFPALRIGRPEHWMRGHLWLGLLIVPFAFFHAGFKLGGSLTVVLMILLVLVTLSGILGVILQQILPRVMTTRVPMETIYGQIDHVLAQLLSEADALVSGVVGPVLPMGNPAPVGAGGGVATLEASSAMSSKKATRVEGSLPMRDFYLNHVRPFLESKKISGPLANAQRAAAAFAPVKSLVPTAAHEALADLEVICEERRQIAVQERLHQLLHGWLIVHVPLSYALLLLSAVHAAMAVRY